MQCSYHKVFAGFGEETDHLLWKYFIRKARKGNNPTLLLDRFYPAWQKSTAAELHSACSGTQTGETYLRTYPTLHRNYKPSHSTLRSSTLHFVLPLRGH